MITPSRLRWLRLLFAFAAFALSVDFLRDALLLVRSPEVDRHAWALLEEIAAPLAAILLGLPFGVLIDRVRRRSVLIAMALLGTTALAAVAAADGAGLLGGPLLFTVLMVTTALGALAPIGSETYLPSVVGRERLVTANALLSVSPSFIMFALAAALSLADHLDEVGFPIVVGVLMAVAALAFRGVTAVEEPPPPRTGFWREAAEGVRFTVREPALRAIAVYLVASELFEQVAHEVMNETRQAAAAAGDLPMGYFYSLMSTFSSVASLLLGALLAVLLHRRHAPFRLAWAALLASQPFTLLLALSGTAWGQLWHAFGTFVPQTGTVIVAILLISHRQAITPDRLLGRVSGLLVGLVALADSAGELLEAPAEWLAGIGGPAPTPLTLLPGAALAAALALAAAVPLLRRPERALT
ncbi:MFS transporter [Nonomuraea sp. MTCD27]|uniref:MFS transporter n=1 Tax=Nonomuraea sp. MTCD27 TaxID=1676747 RepID=UPI0035C11A88